MTWWTTNEYGRLALAIDFAYRDLLKRPADPGGLGSYLGHMREHGRTLAWVRDDLMASDEYMHLPPPPTEPPVPTPLPIPPIRVHGRLLRPSPRFCTAFRLLKHLADGREDTAIEFLDWAGAVGFNGVRVLRMAAALFDLPPAIGEQHAPRLAYLCSERGLYLQLVLWADTRQLGMPDNRTLLESLKPWRNIMIEAANEWHHPAWQAIPRDRLIDAMIEAQEFGYLAASSAPNDDEDTRDLTEGHVLVRHLDRHRDRWNLVRRVRELGRVSVELEKPVHNNEPIGAGEIEQPGRRLDDPAIFFCMGALEAGFGVSGCFHFEGGLWASVPSAGSWQDHCARAWIKGRTIVGDDTRLYKDRRFYNAGWSSSPCLGADWSKIIRVYSFVEEGAGRGVAVLVGAEPQSEDTIVWGNGWRPGRTLGLWNSRIDGRAALVLTLVRL